MIDKKYHLSIAGFYCVIAMIIATVTSVIWSISAGVSMLIWFVVTILFGIIHGLYVGGVFFKRGEEVLLDLEDSQTYIHTEVENVRGAIQDFSQNLENIASQQEFLNQKNKENAEINEKLTSTMSQISENFESQKTDIHHLRHSLEEIRHNPPIVQQVSSSHAPEMMPSSAQEKMQLKNQDEISIRPAVKVQAPILPATEQPTAPLQAENSKKENFSAEELLSESFDTNALPDFLDEDDDYLKEDFFLDGMSEEFSMATQEKRNFLEKTLDEPHISSMASSLEDEEFADVTDILKKQAQLPDASPNISQHAQELPDLLAEEFMTLVPKKEVPEALEHHDSSLSEVKEIIPVMGDTIDESGLFEKESFLNEIDEDDIASSSDMLSIPQESEKDQHPKTKESPSKRSSVKTIKKYAVQNAQSDDAPLPSLDKLLPETVRVPKHPEALSTSSHNLPSLDKLLGKSEQGRDVSNLQEGTKESFAERLDNTPVMQQRQMDGDIHAAIRALQQQAQMQEEAQNIAATAQVPNVKEDIKEDIKEEITQAIIAEHIQKNNDIIEERNFHNNTLQNILNKVDRHITPAPALGSTPAPALIEQTELTAPQVTAEAMPENADEKPIFELPHEDADQNIQPASSDISTGSTVSRRGGQGEAPRSKDLIFAETTPKDIIQTLRYALEHNAIDTCIRTVLDPITQEAHFLEGVNYMRDEDGYYHPPKAFEHAASKLGLDKTIDQILVTRIIQTIRALFNIEKNLRIFTNISVKTLCDEGFEEELLDMVQEKSDITHSIIFEITQKQLSYLNSVRLEKIKYLAECGFEFSLDHITADLPDLRELYTLGFRFLKVSPQTLDRGINIAGQNVEGRELRQLCLAMGLKLIIEQVNVHNDLLIVMNNGSDFVQGEMIAPLERLDQLNIDML